MKILRLIAVPRPTEHSPSRNTEHLRLQYRELIKTLKQKYSHMVSISLEQVGNTQLVIYQEQHMFHKDLN